MGRPNITDRDLTFWLALLRMLKDGRDAVVIVHPATVFKWHRNGFRPAAVRRLRGAVLLNPGGEWLPEWGAVDNTLSGREIRSRIPAGKRSVSEAAASA